MNWSKGDVSTIPAQVGFNFGGEGIENSFSLPNSVMKKISDNISNINTPGHFIFQIDDVVAQPYSKSVNGR